jgi:glycine hydroxymethyltransferase
MVASGIRLGTPAMTTRGLGIAEMDVVADAIARVLAAPADPAVRDAVRRSVSELCAAYPLP